MSILFNNSTGYITPGSAKLDPVITKYEKSSQYIAYEKVSSNVLEQCVNEYFLPALEKALGRRLFIPEFTRVITSEVAENNGLCLRARVSFVPYNITVLKKDDSGVSVDYEYNEAKIAELETEEDIAEFVRVAEDNRLNGVHLGDFPYMDKSSVLMYNNNRYAVINTMSIEDSVTFIQRGNKMKIVNGATSIEISGGAKPVLSLFKKKIPLVKLIGGFVSKDYYSSLNLTESDVIENMLLSVLDVRFRERNIAGTSEYYKESVKTGKINQAEFSVKGRIDEYTSVGNQTVLNDFGFNDNFDKGYFDTDSIRRELNNLLSFDKAIGKTISRDIVGSFGSSGTDKVVLKAGTVLTSKNIKTLNSNLIDTIYVKSVPKIVGKYLAVQENGATLISVSQVSATEPDTYYILKGTPVTSFLRRVIPELDSMDFADKDYNLPKGVSYQFSYGNKIDSDTLKLLDFMGYTEINYADSPSGAPKVAYFHEEYINNRHWLLSDLEKGPLAETDKFIKYAGNLESISAAEYRSKLEIAESDEYEEDEEGKHDDNICNPYVYVDLDGNILAPSARLTSHDIIALTSLYLKLTSGEHFECVSDPDLSLRKKVDQYDEHFRKAFMTEINLLVRFNQRKILKTLNTMVLSKNAFENGESCGADFFNKLFAHLGASVFKRMRGPMKVLDVLTTINPMATISDLTKVNVFVKDSNSIADASRRLTLLHYGVLCPFETPQSAKLGVVNNSAISCTIKDGVFYSDFFKVIHEDGKHFIDLSNKVRLSVNDRVNYRITTISNVTIDEVSGKSNGLFQCYPIHDKILATIPNTGSLDNVTVDNIDFQYIDYVSASADSNISWVCSTVPYAGFDDATRVSFGLSMAKAVKPLINPETPHVCTMGYKNIIRRTRLYYVFSEIDGIVTSVGKDRIWINPRYEHNKDSSISYEYACELISNESVIYCKPVVRVGDEVKAGQALVVSNFIKDDTMALGRNILVGYMTDGYNYEDGQPISEQTAIDLTSIGVHTDKESYKDVNSRSAKTLLIDEIYDTQYFNYLNKGDRLCMYRNDTRAANGHNGTYKNKSSGKPMKVKNCKGFLVKVVRESNHGSIDFVATSVSFDEVVKSDKLCNRHGNKGVTCQLYANKDMPYLTNGIPLGILYNPSGIVTRMNDGQLLEAATGLSCHVLGVKVLIGTYSTLSKHDIRGLLHYTVAMMNSDDDKEVEEIYKVFSKQTPNSSIFTKYKFLEGNDFVIPRDLHDFVVNRINLVRAWRGAFNEDGKAYVINPKSGKRLPNMVQVGVNYVYKLKQEGSGKLHARSGMLESPYVESTQSPTKGSSKAGGQKTGVMELDAMSAHGASKVIEEIYNNKSSNYIKRNNLTVSKALGPDSKFILDDSKSARGTVEMMVRYYEALGLKIDIDEIDTSYSKKKLFYKADTIREAMVCDYGAENIEAELERKFKNEIGSNPIKKLHKERDELVSNTFGDVVSFDDI